MRSVNSLIQSLLKSQVYAQIPLDQVIDRQRFVVFRIFTFTAVVVCISVFTKMLLTLSNVNWLPFAVLFLGISILLNYLRINKDSQLSNAYIVLMSSCLLLLHCVAYSCGGIRTGGSFFLMAVIIYGFMLLGRKGGLVLTITALLHVGLMFYFSTFTTYTSFSLFEDKVDLINEDFLTNIVLSIVLISALSMYLQSERNVIIQRVLESKKELELINIELKSQNLALEKKNAELDKFASLASHDLRSPLRAIGSLSDMILEDDPSMNSESKEKLEVIRNRTHRMDRLLSALLEYSRADRQSKDIANTDVGNIILNLKQKHAYKQQVQISVSKHLPQIHTSALNLERVFDELINNAIQFNSKENIQIDISAVQTQSHWQFSIRDNGPGIDDAFKEKVFIIFQTLQNRDSHESAGAGLAIIKKIVDEHQGNIWVTSNQDAGSTFHFTWKESSFPSVQLKTA